MNPQFLPRKTARIAAALMAACVAAGAVADETGVVRIGDRTEVVRISDRPEVVRGQSASAPGQIEQTGLLCPERLPAAPSHCTDACGVSGCPCPIQGYPCEACSDECGHGPLGSCLVKWFKFQCGEVHANYLENRHEFLVKCGLIDDCPVYDGGYYADPNDFYVWGPDGRRVFDEAAYRRHCRAAGERLSVIERQHLRQDRIDARRARIAECGSHADRRLHRLTRSKLNYFIPAGAGGKGVPPHGCYHIVYPLNPWHGDCRDSGVYAAQGYGGPVSVPLAPVVRHSYNYSWGVPSSRLTPMIHMTPAPYGYAAAPGLPAPGAWHMHANASGDATATR